MRTGKKIKASIDHRTEPITVTAAVIRRGGRILVVRKAPGTRHAGGWEFPGGKVEPGETPEQCLVREIAEELGIDVRVTGFLCESVYAYDHATIRLLAYHTQWRAGDIRLTDHDAMAWKTPSALTEMALLPADVPVAEALGRQSAAGA